eukprot:5840977-Heterocapsa_arctica.AAC.1
MLLRGATHLPPTSQHHKLLARPELPFWLPPAFIIYSPSSTPPSASFCTIWMVMNLFCYSCS